MFCHAECLASLLLKTGVMPYRVGEMTDDVCGIRLMPFDVAWGLEASRLPRCTPQESYRERDVL
jgi:hypothetical protein